jgi:hypothetical protein
MKSKLSLFMVLISIANLVSANSNPCLNFTDWINFKTHFVSQYYNGSKLEYQIKFNNISHENKA